MIVVIKTYRGYDRSEVKIHVPFRAANLILIPKSSRLLP